MGHVWDEVWLGEWVAVDPSQNQAIPDALLLKLVDSNNVHNIQKFQTGLIGNLGVSIEDVQLPEPETGEDIGAKTGIYGHTYLNAEFHCQMKAPGGWKLIEITGQEWPVLAVQAIANKNVTGVLTMFAFQKGTTLEQFLNARFPELRIDTGQGNQTGQPAALSEKTLYLCGSFVFGDNDIKFRQQNWIAVSGNQGYLLVFLAPDTDWDSFENDFAILREQFKVSE